MNRHDGRAQPRDEYPNRCEAVTTAGRRCKLGYSITRKGRRVCAHHNAPLFDQIRFADDDGEPLRKDPNREPILFVRLDHDILRADNAARRNRQPQRGPYRVDGPYYYSSENGRRVLHSGPLIKGDFMWESDAWLWVDAHYDEVERAVGQIEAPVKQPAKQPAKQPFSTQNLIDFLREGVIWEAGAFRDERGVYDRFDLARAHWPEVTHAELLEAARIVSKEALQRLDQMTREWVERIERFTARYRGTAR